MLLVAFGVASAMSPAAEKYLTIVDTPESPATGDCAESTGLEGVAEGRGKMQVRPLTAAEIEVENMEGEVADAKKQ